VPPSNIDIPTRPSPVTRISLAIATVGGIGYAPFAPGTFGSAAGLVVWWLLGPSPVRQAVAIVVIFATGIVTGSVCERHFCRTDPGHVVIDEVAGMLITLLLVPVGWMGMIGGFLLFRILDVIKPFPADRFEALHGGLGVMADDAMAAVYANLALRACIWLSSRLVT
jgi:phosphatidylglycerophosphatase A